MNHFCSYQKICKSFFYLRKEHPENKNTHAYNSNDYSIETFIDNPNFFLRKYSSLLPIKFQKKRLFKNGFFFISDKYIIMADTYPYDDQNGRLAQQNQLQPLQAPPQRSLWETIKQNKLAVIIGLLILAGLIWWFCMRKTTDSGAAANVSVNLPATPTVATVPGNKLNLTRVRGGMF